VIALIASKFEQILNYVVSVDVIFFALSAVCVFVFKRRAPEGGCVRVPGHP
jgi:APA family basic amino acid/polyamine antiporter